MEQFYGVYLGEALVGKVQVSRRGLYYHFCCRCRLSGGGIYRLQVACNGRRENLGILVPMGDGFGIDTKLPVKRLGEDDLLFRLVSKNAIGTGNFIPISPEEPFAYIARLKNAYLVKRNGQAGIMLE